MNREFVDSATTLEEVAVGAAQAAAEVASDPIRAARKQVRSLERKGAPAVRRINRRVGGWLPHRALGIELNGKLPEEFAIKGLRSVKSQARREDAVGGVARRMLRIVNGSLGAIARAATRLAQASDPGPQRPVQQKPAAGRARRRPARRRVA
jgi:hypothetical protein